MKEWKDVKGYEGFYQVSNNGDVKSLSRLVKHPKGGYKRIRERIMSCKNGRDFYDIVVLYQEGVSKTKLVHRLVAEAYLSNPENLPQVNHKDGNKLNNSVDNLEWCSLSEQRFHAYRIGLQKPAYSMLGKKGKDCPNSIPVVRILSSGQKEHYDSFTIAMRQTGVDRSLIGKCASGKIVHAGGFKWEYGT